MEAQEIKQLMRQRPFVPFRLHLKGGRNVDILYPFFHLARREFFDIGRVPPNDPCPYPVSWEPVPYDRIEGVQLIPNVVPPDLTDQCPELIPRR